MLETPKHRHETTSNHIPAPTSEEQPESMQTAFAAPRSGMAGAPPPPNSNTNLSRNQQQVLNMQRTQGNAAVRRMLAAQPAATVQRDSPAAAPGPQGQLKFPYEFNLEKKIDKKFLKYFKLSKANLKFKGAVQTSTPKGTTNTTAVAPLGVSQGAGKPTQVTTGVENKQVFGAEEATQTVKEFFDSEWVNEKLDAVEPYGKATGSGKVGTSEASGKLAYELGADIKFKSGLKVTGATEFVLWEGKSKVASPSDLQLSATAGAFVPKVAGSGKFKDKPKPGWEIEIGVEGSLTIEPDWTAIFVEVIKGIAENPEIWIFAALAAGLVISVVEYGHIEERQKLATKAKFVSRSLIKASNLYGALLTGDKFGASGKVEQKAAEQAGLDLPKVLLKYGSTVTPEVYFEALKMRKEWKDTAFSKARSDFKDKALAEHRSKMTAQVEAWHSEHGVQSLFLGGKGADERLVDSVIDNEDANDGMDTMG